MAPSRHPRTRRRLLTTRKIMKVDVTIDVSCVYSYLGVQTLLTGESPINKYRLAHPEKPFQPVIRLLPCMLYPSATERPSSRAEHFIAKLGPEGAAATEKSLVNKFAAIGVDYKLGGQVSSPHMANRLLTYALFVHPSCQLPLAADILRRIHVENKHASDRAMLADAAVANALFPSITKAMLWLDRSECDEEVRRAYDISKRVGVTAAPFYVFDDRWAVVGSQSVSEFSRLFDDILRRAESITSSPTSTLSSPTSPRAPSKALPKPGGFAGSPDPDSPPNTMDVKVQRALSLSSRASTEPLSHSSRPSSPSSELGEEAVLRL